MKVTLTAAHRRIQSADFVTLYRWERVQLRTLSWVSRILYEELVGLSNFKTGHLYSGTDPRVSYAVLLALMTPDQPPHGKRLPAPSLKQLRDALDDLESVGLLGRNTKANLGLRSLFLEVPSRAEAQSRTANLGRAEGRGDKVKKAIQDKKLPKFVHKPRAEARAGVSEGNSFITPLPHENEKLSTDDRLKPPEPDTPPGPITLSMATPKIVPPRGQDTSPAGTPPDTSGREAAMRVADSLRKRKIAPPGGTVDAPQGAGGAPHAADILQPMLNAVLKVAAGESPDASRSSTTRSKGRDGL